MQPASVNADLAAGYGVGAADGIIRSMIVLLDVDGVVSNFNGSFLREANRILKRSYELSQVTEWDTAKALGLTREEEERVFYVIRQPGFALSIDPYPEAKEGFEKLSRLAEVYFVTTPMRGPRDETMTWMHDREHWLHDHFGVPHNRVIHCNAKERVRGDIFVDDKPANVRRWAEHNPLERSVLWHQEYNRSESLLRVFGWDDLCELAICGWRGTGSHAR